MVSIPPQAQPIPVVTIKPAPQANLIQPTATPLAIPDYFVTKQIPVKPGSAYQALQQLALSTKNRYKPANSKPDPKSTTQQKSPKIPASTQQLQRRVQRILEKAFPGQLSPRSKNQTSKPAGKKQPAPNKTTTQQKKTREEYWQELRKRQRGYQQRVRQLLRNVPTQPTPPGGTNTGPRG